VKALHISLLVDVNACKLQQIALAPTNMAPGSKLDSGSFERRAALRHSLSSLEINMSMQQHADQLIEHIGNNFRVFMPLDSAPKSRAEFDSQLKQVFTATVDVPALREYLLKRFTIYSNSLWERYSALVNKSVKGSKKSHDISLLCTDKEFDTAVDRIEAGSINDADAFSRLLITPGAPASVATSYLHSRLSKQINAAEYVPTLAATSRTYGVAQITDIIEMAQHFLSDVKVHASLITRAPQIASFVSLCMFRFQQCAEYSAQARSRFAEALTCLCCEEFTLDFEEAEQSAAKSVDSDSDSDDESAFNKSSSASSDSISQQRIDSFLQSLSAYLSASSSATSGALARRVLLFTERFRHLIHQCIEDDHEFANFAVDLVLNVTDQAHRRRLPSQPVVMLVHALFQSIDTDSLAAPMVFVKCAQFGRHSATLGAGTLNKWKRLAALVAETLLPRLDRVPIPAPLVAKMSALRAQRLSDLITSTKVTDDTIESLMALVRFLLQHFCTCIVLFYSMFRLSFFPLRSTTAIPTATLTPPNLTMTAMQMSSRPAVRWTPKWRLKTCLSLTLATRRVPSCSANCAP
jgi:hypothetical protein